MATNLTLTHGFRSKLAETHIAVVAVAVLVMWSLDGFFRLAWISLSAALWLIAKAADFLNIPYVFDVAQSLTRTNSSIVGGTFFNFLSPLTCALLISRSVYGVRPFRALKETISHFSRRSFAKTLETKPS
jgi:hypothetical protein